MDGKQQTLAILFADIAGSTELYQSVGDVEAHRRVAESLAHMAQATRQHGGSVLRTVGDSTLASFDSCDDALMAACAMQTLHENTPLSVRVGFHYGPVIPDKGDVYGNAVNIAARVASFARSEEITATESSIAQLGEQNRHRASLLDKISVKGVAEPLGVYRIIWQANDEMHTRVAPSVAAALQTNDQLTMRITAASGEYIIAKDSPTLTLGRDEQCSIVIDGDQVSRAHAQLQWMAGQVQLSDTSTNGCYVHREGQAALFVRRETIVLDGVGTIGLGCAPTDVPEHRLHFQVLQ